MLVLSYLVFTVSAVAAEIADSQESGSSKRDSIQSCIDQIRRQREADRQAAGAPPAPGSGAVKRPNPFHKISPEALPLSCPSGDLEKLRSALKNQLASCSKKKTSAKTIVFGCHQFTEKEYCFDVNTTMLDLALKSKTFAEFMTMIKDEFEWYKNDGMAKAGTNFKKGDVQFTAYYTPAPIEASRTPTSEFTYPLYRKPANHVTAGPDRNCGNEPVLNKPFKYCQQVGPGTYAPLPTHEQIDIHGALKGKGLEIAYIRDPLDAAFLMVEGSGAIKVKQPDGQWAISRVNFDSQNGWPNNMLARVMGCDGVAKENWASESAIRAYLKDKPDVARKYMNYSQAYVFYKEETGGPFGADGIPITQDHSFATDHSIIPTGTVMLYNAGPKGAKGPCAGTTSGVAISQDSGGAIAGPHVDMYKGEGRAAKDAANDVNMPGSLFVAVPKGAGVDVCTP